MLRLTVSPGASKRFKGLSVAVASVQEVGWSEASSGVVDTLVSSAEESARARWPDLESLARDAHIRAYRAFYWQIGVDPTKTRPANEALLRRVVDGEGLPRINTIVDAYNAASIWTGLPMCAYDAEKFNGPTVVVRSAEAGEKFFGIGMDEPMTLTGKELVLSDDGGIVSLYPYRDGDRTRVTPQSRSLLLTVDGIPEVSPLELLNALKVCVRNVTRAVGGKATVVL